MRDVKCLQAEFVTYDCLLKKLQAIQNLVARVVTGTRKFDRITPVLCDLHWLPIRQRILFKLAVIVFKCLHGLAPSYLEEHCVLASAAASWRHLRSADTMKLLVRRTRTVIGARGFAVSAAAISNSLPAALSCLPARLRHLHGNWKLSKPARRCRPTTSEDHLFCTLQMY